MTFASFDVLKNHSGSMLTLHVAPELTIEITQFSDSH